MMRIRTFLVRALWRSIRWRKRLIMWLVYPKVEKIKPLNSKMLDGFNANFYCVDEWSELRRKRDG